MPPKKAAAAAAAAEPEPAEPPAQSPGDEPAKEKKTGQRADVTKKNQQFIILIRLSTLFQSKYMYLYSIDSFPKMVTFGLHGYFACYSCRCCGAA